MRLSIPNYFTRHTILRNDDGKTYKEIAMEMGRKTYIGILVENCEPRGDLGRGTMGVEAQRIAINIQ